MCWPWRVWPLPGCSLAGCFLEASRLYRVVSTLSNTGHVPLLVLVSLCLLLSLASFYFFLFCLCYVCPCPFCLSLHLSLSVSSDNSKLWGAALLVSPKHGHISGSVYPSMVNWVRMSFWEARRVSRAQEAWKAGEVSCKVRMVEGIV